MKRTNSQILIMLFLFVLSSCTFNASLKNLQSGLGSGELVPNSLQKIFVDVTDVTFSEGSVAIINVAVNPVRSEDTVIYLTLNSSSSGYVRFNPIPNKVIIPAGSTSKSIVLNTVDDSLNQDQEQWTFAISSEDPSINADPSVLNIKLNDNDGGFVPNSPITAGPKLLKEFNAYPTNINTISALGKVFYVGTDASNGSELWVSDGTAIGTKLVKDIEPGAGSSSITSFKHPPASPYVFFVATTSSEGEELWRTDGTEQGTQLVKEFEPGASSSEIYFLYVYGDKIFFNASTTIDGTELYISDGTYSGTKMLYESVPGTSGGGSNSIIADGSDIYFSDYNYSDYTGKLFRTDGNPANNTLIVTGTSAGLTFSDDLSLHFIHNGYVYFSTYTGYGTEIFATAGSNATTAMLKDIYPGGMSSYATAANQMVLNNKVVVVFSYESSGSSTGYYLTDGTPAGTTKVTQPVSAGGPMGILGGNKYIFSGCINNYDCEIYSSSGVNGDAILLKDIHPGTSSGNANSSSPSFAARLGEKIIFTATNATEGVELYVTDGSPAGTLLLKDIYAGSAGSSPSNFVVAGSKLIFRAKSDVYGEELWVTDGTPAGTVLFKDLFPGTKSSGPKNLTAIDPTHIFLTGYNSSSQFASVFVADISAQTTTGFGHAMVESLNTETKNLVEYNGLVYFDAMDSNNGNPLWVTNGSEAGTTKLADLYPNITCSDINYMTVFNGSLFFAASTEANGQELFVSNGTTAGTNIIKELASGTVGAYINTSFTKTDTGKMFFGANDNSGIGFELFATDGSTAGTALVKDLNAGSTSSNLSNITAIPGTNKVILYTNTPYGFWTSNGTSAGTTQISGLSSISSITSAPKTISSGSFISYSEASTYKQRIYFVNAVTNAATHLNTTYTTDVVVGTPFLNPTSQTLYYLTTTTAYTSLNLWKSDGTGGGTSLVKNIPISGNNFGVTHIANFGNKTLFQYYNNTTSPYVRQLWVTDGTSGGTSVVDSVSSTNSTMYTAGYEFNGDIYFTKHQDATGVELWKTDGASANATLVKDINPGASSSSPNILGTYNGKLYFSANDGTHGVELWRTDGSLSGTEMVADINPGQNSSSPTKLKVLAGKIFFLATKVLSGTEVWTYSE